ncbi:hypothetical protein MCC93_14640 [Morococcus cerebrosus]|uniref:Uncharacterized protein n=1 Tax=Morococcus cerebrosus TaxID=1056807 RepID=A0A0C1GZE8_9NEIS|nr:hypothetical protein MCC93_14640 [Morococcus cerebrosus]
MITDLKSIYWVITLRSSESSLERVFCGIIMFAAWDNAFLTA